MTKSANPTVARTLNGSPTPDDVFQELQGNNSDGTANPALTNYLDTDNLIDYMILHLYAGAEDWPHHNWYAARDRVGESKGFQFFVWDQEIVLDGQFRDRTDVGTAGNHANTPAELYDLLRNSPEFQLRFADRVQKHLFNGGALTTPENQARWLNRADEIEAAIIGESARWGDAREGEIVTGYIGGVEQTVEIGTMDVNDWRLERDNVHDNYFTQSHTNTISRFTADSLFPTSLAPVLNQYGGLVGAGFNLTMVSPTSGIIFYTTDGSDPRYLTTNSSSGQAIVYSGTIPLSVSTPIQARVLDGAGWSPLIDTFFTITNPLRISEIMFIPTPQTTAELAATPGGSVVYGNDQYEFLEILNTSGVDIALAGVNFDDGIAFTFDSGEGILGGGERIVVVRNLTAFENRYDTSNIRVAIGQYGDELDPLNDSKLSNGGEELSLRDATAGLIQTFRYDDKTSEGWYDETDGGGKSLVIIDPSLDVSTWDLPESWQPSIEDGGSPGTTETLIGDLDGDALVGLRDLLVLKKNSDPLAIDKTFAQGDLNGDGAVGTDNLAILLSNYGRVVSLPVSAPVPAAALVVSLASSQLALDNHNVVESTIITTINTPDPANNRRQTNVAATRRTISKAHKVATDQVLSSSFSERQTELRTHNIRRAHRGNRTTRTEAIFETIE